LCYFPSTKFKYQYQSIMDILVAFLFLVIFVLIGITVLYRNRCHQLEGRLKKVGDLILKENQVNKNYKKQEKKIVDNISLTSQQVLSKQSFCRCWKSKQFPYCDGTHNEHNTASGDNVGPLNIMPGSGS